jgi:hypothetical protein
VIIRSVGESIKSVALVFYLWAYVT